MLYWKGDYGRLRFLQVASPQRAAEVFPSLNGVRRSAIAWKQFLANRHTLARWLWSRRHGTLATLQKVVVGREATTMFACWDGVVLASVTAEVLASKRPAGAATILRLVRNDEIERASCLMAQRLRLSGFHGLDFIIEEGTDAGFLIEMNPCTYATWSFERDSRGQPR